MTDGRATMVDEVDAAVALYEGRWRGLLSSRPELAVLGGLPVTSAGWKVIDPAQYDRRLMELRGSCEHIVETWMNDRWVAKCILRAPLSNGCRVIKLMQRRPGSKDAVGLDHLDFLCADLSAVESLLDSAGGIDWRRESNDIYPEWHWISLHFDGFEAKFKDYTVLDISARMLADTGRLKHKLDS